MTAAAAKAEFVQALGVILRQALPTAALSRVNVAVVAKAADPALAAGWPGAELARAAIMGVATGDNPGGLLVGNLRALATAPPPTTAAARPASGPGCQVTTPQPLPECAKCATPFRRGVAAAAQCPSCGAQLRLVEHDAQAVVARRLSALVGA